VSERFPELNQTGVEFLLLDLDLALTFLDVSETSHVEETTRRNHLNARKAYDAVSHLLKTVTLDEGQRQMMDAKLSLLKKRLQAVGQQL
jgi:hypothetical protein